MTVRSWVSGTESPVGITVCPGDLVTPRIQAVSGVDGKGSSGRPVHLLYFPNEQGASAPAGAVGGETDASDPVKYEHDLSPIWCPYAGTICLSGGNGGGTFTVRFERARGVPERRAPKPTMTLRDIRLTAIAIPRGTWALRSNVDTSADFVFAGEHTTLSLPAGKLVEIGGLSLGTIAATAANIELLVCHLRF